jgi:hypothetical protein
LKDFRAEWFENVDHDEIKQQLRGEAPSTFTYVKPEFDCPVRSHIAKVFGSEEIMEAPTWSDTVRALSALCLQKPKIHSKASDGGGNMCPFCYGDDTLRPVDRFHSFHSIGTLRMHATRVHSSTTTSLSSVKCPYVECETTLEQGEHLKSHLATIHNLNL